MAQEFQVIVSDSCKLNTEKIAAALSLLIPLSARKVEIDVKEVHSEFNQHCSRTVIER